MDDPTQPFLVFTVNNQEYAFAIDEVVEVAALVAPFAWIGNHVPAVYGTVVRRGEPLALVDLRRVFDAPNAPFDRDTLFIVAELQHQRAGFIVDRVQGVVYFAQHEQHPLATPARLMRGLLRSENRFIQWLALDALMTIPTEPGSYR